ncbi:MAG: zinc ribbon domain-containing protein [Thermoanaerobaculia bacterium]
MPIYEFYCPVCHTVFSFFSSRIDTAAKPACPQCARPELERKPSRFAAISRGKAGEGAGGDAGDDGDDPLAGLDDDRMAGVMDSLASEMEGMDESAQQDPKQLAQFLAKFQEATGLEAGPRMEEMLARLKEGADMDELESEMGGGSPDGNGEDGYGPGGSGGAGGADAADDFSDYFRAKRPARAPRGKPRVDETLHFL